MLKLVLRLGIGSAAVFFSALGVFLVYAYTRPVRISPNRPSKHNDDLIKEILSAKNVLFIGAHPDDVEFYCAALVYEMRRNGTDVSFAIATRGGKGRQGNAKARLEKLRTLNQKDAADILGGADIILYDYPDKALPSHVNDFSDDLKKLIAKKQPDLILCWDPDYIYNPHPDHQAAADSAQKALKDYKGKVCYYGTHNPNLWYGYDRPVFNIKYKSLRAHRTETPWPYSTMVKRLLVKRTGGEGAKINAEYAETYRVIRS